MFARVASGYFLQDLLQLDCPSNRNLVFLLRLWGGKMDNATLSLSYNSLWKLLIDRKLKKKDLQNMAHLSSSVIAKMGKDQPVHLDTIVKICVALQCDISDVVTLCNKEA